MSEGNTMKKSPLVLEVDDRLAEDRKVAKRSAGRAEDGRPPLETNYERESPPSPRIKVNLNFRPGNVDPNDLNRFDRDRLFDAVACGNPELLEGLGEYLQRRNKFLTNSEYRDGKTGKTCLMKALLNLKDGVNPTIPLLLEIDKETENPTPLINAACCGICYQGQTALHIAIEKRNLDLVRLLVENGADVHARASGGFFQQQSRGVGFYFGELPLSLAACTNQPEVVRYLLENPHQKARLTEQDSKGNTVLHALVRVANDTEKNTEIVIGMYDMILMKGAEIDPSWRLEEIVNRDRQTPLKLAAKTGKVENRYKMVALEPLNRLLQHKWESFVAKRFFFSLFLHVIFMVIFTATAYYRPLDGEPPVSMTLTAKGIWRLIGPVIVLIGGIYLFIAQSFYFWRRRLSWKKLITDGCFEFFLYVHYIMLRFLCFSPNWPS